MSAGRYGLPWKRGPKAWEVVRRADGILGKLAATPRRYLGLRRTAALLGTSTKPVREWIRLGYLKRDARLNRVDREELRRFVRWLEKEAEPHEENRAERFHAKRRHPPRPFDKLRHARFEWPKGVTSLTPAALARLVGCHPSQILLAIRCGRLPDRHRTRCRRKVSRRAWTQAFGHGYG